MQSTLLDQIEVKIDGTTKRFVFANKKMKELLDESGGMTRWCPIMIAIIVLLALGGYIVTATSGS